VLPLYERQHNDVTVTMAEDYAEGAKGTSAEIVKKTAELADKALVEVEQF